jgi:hypothetical protein
VQGPGRAVTGACGGGGRISAVDGGAAIGSGGSEAETLLAAKARGAAQIVDWMHVSLHFQ